MLNCYAYWTYSLDYKNNFQSLYMLNYYHATFLSPIGSEPLLLQIFETNGQSPFKIGLNSAKKPYK